MIDLGELLVRTLQATGIVALVALMVIMISGIIIVGVGIYSAFIKKERK